MASWRPALAGGAAFVTSMAAEIGVMTGLEAAIGGAGGWLAMPLVVAPVAEELAKRFFLWPFSARWAATGLAFGVIEALLKTAEWHVAGLWGGLASVMQHWAYGRWAERGGLWLALALHATFNAVVIAVDYATDASAGWVAPLVAAVLLGASFRGSRRGDPGGAQGGVIDAGRPAP
jgi:hypothetical protein